MLGHISRTESECQWTSVCLWRYSHRGRGHVAVACPHLSCTVTPISHLFLCLCLIVTRGNNTRSFLQRCFPHLLWPFTFSPQKRSHFPGTGIIYLCYKSCCLHRGLFTRWIKLDSWTLKKKTSGSSAFVCLSAWTLPLRFPVWKAVKGKKRLLSKSFHGLSPVYVHITSLRLTDLTRSPRQCLYPKHSAIIVIKKWFKQNK